MAEVIAFPKPKTPPAPPVDRRQVVRLQQRIADILMERPAVLETARTYIDALERLAYNPASCQ
ncbi:MAG: hypothetical protein AAFV53_19920 [Myxococcota bacterium]